MQKKIRQAERAQIRKEVIEAKIAEDEEKVKDLAVYEDENGTKFDMTIDVDYEVQGFEGTLFPAGSQFVL